MKRYSLENMKLGWFIGNFNPSLLKTESVEVGIKRFVKGQKELTHYQTVATEWTCVIQGRIRIGVNIFDMNEIAEIPPLERADFEALEDSILVVVKSPSMPNDKKIDEEI
jgi:hypothetical protein